MRANDITIGWGIYLLAFLALFSLSADSAGGLASHHLVWSIGLIAIWRYSWQGLHFARAQLYVRRRFPQWRRMADEVAGAGAGRAREVLVVVTSYQMPAEDNYETYAALFREAIDYGAPTTIVASVTDKGDARLLEDIFSQHAPPDDIGLITQLQAGTGKRDAMAAALRAGAQTMSGDHGVAILMDGDTLVTPGLFARCFPFFTLMPDLGALTVNNEAEVRGSQLARDWYMMRFALRNLYMSSLSLSRKVLCLTGRFSVFRAEIACSADFIAALENDSINHWRLGRLKFLTGDDKSTWYHCLKNQWSMIYLPDTFVKCVEELPSGGFFRAAPKLMHRWFGNMLRNSDRAVGLGPRRMGAFTWWCLVDQRLNMWTSISGPVFMGVFILDGRPEAVLAYFTFVLASRFVQTANVALHGGRFSPRVPFLLFYQQIVGALLKINVMFHLDRQSWTRQKIGSGARKAAFFSQDTYGAALNLISILIFVSLMSVVSGAVAL